MLYREAYRAGTDEEKRTASFVAATENPVSDRWGEPEILRMKGVDLERFQRNPVFLDSHDRSSIDAVIGRVDIQVKGKELIADVTFANHARAQTAWELVRDGFVNSVSVGFAPNVRTATILGEGQKDGDVEGPATIINDWQLLELSQVPVGADPGAVKRAREAFREEAMQYPQSGQGEAPPVVTPPVNGHAERKAQIMAITPTSLRDHAEFMFLNDPDITVEKARQALLAEAEKRSAPVGTPAPAAIAPVAPVAIPDDVFVRSMFGGE